MKLKKILVAAAMLATASLNAQTNSSFTDGLKLIGNAISSSTNWAVVSGYGHSTKGDNNVAFAALSYSLNENVGLLAGYDYLWGDGGSSANTLKGGLTLQLPMHPFGFLGSTFATNIVATPFVADLVATPRHGDAIGNIISTGVNFDVYQFKNFELVSGIQYEKRTGQGGFNGDYILFHVGISRKF